ncbi:hypothetical protein MCOR27_009539 [Pyricularia oryzae]|nr:hypothetical protein MCOR01_005667 [Pyricularia oryzae]KAI6255168.1 hypothetical protein MCOR19_008335 [Pyricularia oryzae]KAI6269912.1 hypothetical protein MCOR27_009539 [Pyricularia oryzae]KAI6272467.1 hypothetical protein MCOR26_007319 [Pyricularia oryzae]KAI6313472.1 hypothetical protein MCOR29_007660 [Pyricularia oryzae]
MAPQQSIRALLAYAGNIFSQVPLGGIANPFDSGSAVVGNTGVQQQQCHYSPLTGAPACPIDGPMSCHNSTPVEGNSCCFVHPGGQLMLTQFWDQDIHEGGSDEDWTIHGLWPDLCNGGYEQFCNIAPQYRNITEILHAHGQADLVSYMNRYWVADRGTNDHLWEHEWNKHGTCINTLAPACYSVPSSSSCSSTNAAVASPGEMAVVDYFTRAVALFKTLDTYTALERAGIVPHARKRYPLVDVQKALAEYLGGGKVALRCRGGNRHRKGDVLNEAWFVYYVKGSLQTGEFVPAPPTGRDATNCAPWIKYPPKRRRGDL